VKQSSLLVVDDDRDVRVTLGDVFRIEGYAVSTASSMEEVRSAQREQPFDVAIVDLRLGDEDGMDIVQYLADNEPTCSVIVLTGYGSLESAQEALRRQAYEFLTKPSDMGQLKAAVARASERTSLLQSLTQRVAELDEAHRELQRLSAQRQEELEAQVRERTDSLVKTNEAMRQEIARRVEAEELMLALSTPVLRIQERLLLVPLIGEMVEARIRTMKTEVLQRVADMRASVLLLDCTGLVNVTDAVATDLVETIAAAELLGASVVLSGLSTRNGRTLVNSGLPHSRALFVGDLEQGIETANKLLAAARPFVSREGATQIW
jgi:ActR/RegA family two-component response regulator/anti-anti-sigma regulatory factor